MTFTSPRWIALRGFLHEATLALFVGLNQDRRAALVDIIRQHLYCGFGPDRVLRQLGIAFVDDTIPGAAVFVGRASDPKKLSSMIRDCQNKGMLIIASYDIIKQLKDEGIAMGLDRMLYPVGEFTQVIHGLNFAIRAALSFGGVQKGDRQGLYNYLSKRPKVFVLQMGPLDFIKVAAEFAVMFNGSPTITDQDVEQIPDKYVVQKNLDEMISTAIEVRGCRIKLGAVSTSGRLWPGL